MPGDDKIDFILRPRIDLDSLSQHLNSFIDATLDENNTINPPEWIRNSWSSHRLTAKLSSYLRRSSVDALANIEKHLRGEDYAPIKDFVDALQSELDSLDRTLMFWKWGEILLKAQGEERERKFVDVVNAWLVKECGSKTATSVSLLEFNRVQPAELTDLINQAELRGWFWR